MDDKLRNQVENWRLPPELAGSHRGQEGEGGEKSESVRPSGGEFPDRLGVREVVLIGERVGDL